VQGVLVPRDPGNLSAFGLLAVDVRNDYVQTAVRRHDALDPAAVGRAFEALRGQAATALDAEGFAAEEQRFVRTADLRYVGQAFEVRVPVPDGPVDATLSDEVAASFHTAHEQLYGYGFRGDPRQPVEWVNLRVSGIGPIRRPEPRELPAGDGDPERARTGTRAVVFEDRRDTPVYWRPSLAPGDVLHGPAVLEEFGSTIPLHPGFTARIDRFGNVLVTRTPSREDAA
jgi:N-methylhydantoinase A